MAAKAYDINSSVINLPIFDDAGLITEIQQSSGVMLDIRRIQYSVLLLTKDVEDRRASFERIAWLNIWTREMHLLEALIAAYDYQTEYLLQVLSRISFELYLQVLTICDPVKDMAVKGTGFDGDQKEILKDRMRAYAAWCLCNDLNYQYELTHPDTLKNFWDPEPARSIKSDPKEYAKYVEIYGVMENEVDEEKLKKGLFKHRDREIHRRNRLQAWLNHPDLKKWTTMLQRRAKHRNSTPNFFSLFEETEKSICSRLRTLNMRFMYVNYVRGSLLVHGSSMESNLYFDHNSFSTYFMNDSASVKNAANSVRINCMNVFLALKILQSTLWEEKK